MGEGKREKYYMALSLVFWLLVFLGGKYTASQGFVWEKVKDSTDQIKVMLKTDEHFQIQNRIQYIKRGGNVVFHVIPDEGYEVKGIDSEAGEIRKLENGITEVAVNKVPDSRAFLCICGEIAAQISYDLNGGKSEKEGSFFTRSYDRTLRKRPNTENGTGITRAGYTLLGWNTKKDGNGIYIGLGSRVTVPKDGKLILYAQWIKESPADDFFYVVRGGEARITSYRGNAETIVIPETLEKCPVTSIAQGAFINKSAKTVVLPGKIRAVESLAFMNCQMEAVYMPDTIEEIQDNSFSGCKKFRTLHINAATPPRYTKTVRMCNYADKTDLLELKEGKPRLICFAGSSMWFNLKGDMAEEAFDHHYQPVNLGLNGFFCSAAQMEIMIHYLEKEDVVIHTPEECSAQQLMNDTSMTQALYACLELNYDLFSYVDIRNLTGVFSSFCEYNQVRSQMEELTYEDYPKEWCVDKYGGFVLTLVSDGKDKKRKDEAYIWAGDITEAGMEKLNRYYGQIQEKTGNKVMVSYSAINYDGLPDECRKAEWELFEMQLGNLLDKKAAALFGRLSDSVMRGREFYASNFHLTTEGAKKWTKMFLDGLKIQMEKEKIWGL